jgi:hypothetical protein
MPAKRIRIDSRHGGGPRAAGGILDGESFSAPEFELASRISRGNICFRKILEKMGRDTGARAIVAQLAQWRTAAQPQVFPN